MEWTESLAVGVELIDSQHKALIKAINDLFEACSMGKGRKKVSDTMQFLQDYINTHFGDEEKLQLRVGYPDYQNHRKLHAEFVASVAGFKEQLDTEGPTISLVAKLNSFVSNWLIHHISVEDKKIGAYMAENGKF